MNGVERVMARFEADPSIFGALSTGEQIAIALTYDRTELLPESYNTRKKALLRLGENWWHMVCAYVKSNSPVWGNKTEIITGMRMCRKYCRIAEAIRALETVADGCCVVGVDFSTDKIEERLSEGLNSVEKQTIALHKKHASSDCTCSFCKRFEELGL